MELNAQRSPSLPTRLFGELLEMPALLDRPYTRHSINPYIRWRRYKAEKGLNNWLRDQIRSHLAVVERIQEKNDIMDIAIEASDGSLSLEEYMVCAKSFLFAGHDTTSALLSWFYYCLAQHPEVMNKMKDEHVEIFGPDGKDTMGIYKQILDNPTKLAALKYTMQCLKEVLRLYPPASTARMGYDDECLPVLRSLI